MNKKVRNHTEKQTDENRTKQDEQEKKTIKENVIMNENTDKDPRICLVVKSSSCSAENTTQICDLNNEIQKGRKADDHDRLEKTVTENTNLDTDVTVDGSIIAQVEVVDDEQIIQSETTSGSKMTNTFGMDVGEIDNKNQEQVQEVNSHKSDEMR